MYRCLTGDGCTGYNRRERFQRHESLHEVVAMARRKSRRRYDWKMILFLVLSVMIALTMVLAFILPALNSPATLP